MEVPLAGTPDQVSPGQLLDTRDIHSPRPLVKVRHIDTGVRCNHQGRQISYKIFLRVYRQLCQCEVYVTLSKDDHVGQSCSASAVCWANAPPSSGISNMSINVCSPEWETTPPYSPGYSQERDSHPATAPSHCLRRVHFPDPSLRSLTEPSALSQHYPSSLPQAPFHCCL